MALGSTNALQVKEKGTSSCKFICEVGLENMGRCATLLERLSLVMLFKLNRKYVLKEFS